jgi:hypothetical protein
VNVHLDPDSNEERCRQISLIYDEIGKDPSRFWVLGGDWNFIASEYDRYFFPTDGETTGRWGHVNKKEADLMSKLCEDFVVTDIDYSFHSFRALAHQKVVRSGRNDRFYVPWREAFDTLYRVDVAPRYAKKVRKYGGNDHVPIWLEWELIEVRGRRGLMQVSEQDVRHPQFVPLTMRKWAQITWERSGTDLWDITEVKEREHVRLQGGTQRSELEDNEEAWRAIWPKATTIRQTKLRARCPEGELQVKKLTRIESGREIYNNRLFPGQVTLTRTEGQQFGFSITEWKHAVGEWAHPWRITEIEVGGIAEGADLQIGDFVGQIAGIRGGKERRKEIAAIHNVTRVEFEVIR